jgi:hypothetical protein
MDDTTLRIDVAEVSEISVGWSSVLMHGFTTFVVSAFALKVEAILFRRDSQASLEDASHAVGTPKATLISDGFQENCGTL